MVMTAASNAEKFSIYWWLPLSPYEPPKKAFYCLYLHFHAFSKKNKVHFKYIEISYLLTYFNFDGTVNKTLNPANIPYLVMLSKLHHVIKVN
jgi:hypothetical protein